MSAALTLIPAPTAPTMPMTAPSRLHTVVRPAPRREPPFDDELDSGAGIGRHDRHLPFAVQPHPVRRLRPIVREVGLPDPEAWSRRFLLGLVEAAGGRRPLHQLSSMVSSSVGRGLRCDFDQPDGRTARWLRRGIVQTVLVCRPANGVAEVAATIGCGPRVRAVALRLEDRRGRWCCTRLQLG